MRSVAVALGILSMLGLALTVRADEGKGDGGKTSARVTAEAWFPTLRKAAADNDEKTLADALPARLIDKFPEQAKDDGKLWRTTFAQRLAAPGPVVFVKEDKDEAHARWKTSSPDTTYELFARFERGRWVVSSPWAWCVGGGPAAAAFAKPSSVKLESRKGKDAPPYAKSAYSFAHVTQDVAKQAKNRPDIWMCAAGHLHSGHSSMLGKIGAKNLAAVDGLQRGGDRMDQVTPKAGGVYVVHCKRDGAHEFQVALEVKACSKSEVEFEWKLAAAGIGGPLTTKKPQPDTSLDGADGADGNCGAE